MSDQQAASKTVFVISPIGKVGTAEHRDAALVLNYIIKKAFTPPKWDVIRADQENSPDSITSQVIERIVSSDLIVADLSNHNPNVFYELAVAHGYRKPVIHLMQEGQKVPFDVVDQRVTFYDLTDPASVEGAQTQLTAAASWVQENPEQLRTPLSSYQAFATMSSSSADSPEGKAAIADILEQILARLQRLEGAVQRERSPRSPVTPNIRKRLSDVRAKKESIQAHINTIEISANKTVGETAMMLDLLQGIHRLEEEENELLAALDAGNN
jgi:nucleoside 2-deoxyribosyltransferase